MDASQWCALERGRRRVTSASSLRPLLVKAETGEETEKAILAALEHDQVIQRVQESSFPEQTTELVSCCLQAARVLDDGELRGLTATVRAVLTSKQQLLTLARGRFPSSAEVDMD